MLETILKECGRFKKEQIKTKITFTIVIHQYLVLKTKDLEIELDPYGFGRRIPYGKHLNTINFLFGDKSFN